MNYLQEGVGCVSIGDVVEFTISKDRRTGKNMADKVRRASDESQSGPLLTGVCWVAYSEYNI